MKRVIKQQDDIHCMSKLTESYADKSIVGDFGKFIYFSESQHSSGPRIIFYGGSENNTNDSPTMTFDYTGPKNIIYEGKKKDYPNLNDDSYVEKVKNFVDKFLPYLLLTWYRYLGEEHLLKYFEGGISLEDLMDKIDVSDDELNKKIRSIKDRDELHKFCLEHDLYNFISRRNK